MDALFLKLSFGNNINDIYYDGLTFLQQKKKKRKHRSFLQAHSYKSIIYPNEVILCLISYKAIKNM